jgi:YidC/Oxa1 family membrane protein insertase
MTLYVGPNKFERLRAFGNDVQDIVPFGWSIFGTINRWVIRPLFGFLSNFFGSKGLVILVLTLLVKLALFPLTYRMIYSQSKMSALKPEMEKVRAKHKEDQQQAQVETMKLYREFGVNPLGSCLPLILQMPIWFALYRFFPASIEFRQEGFWWANDLSSYDEFIQLGFTIPLGIGSHISLFTVLWAVTTLIYTYYNSRHMDMNANPAMKYMQYLMPLFFLGFFNSYASGLTAYLLFSNLTNIFQTLVTKNYIIDQDKIKREMDEYRKKPKKKSNFRKRLEDAMEEQRKIQDQQKKKKKQTKKK